MMAFFWPPPSFLPLCLPRSLSFSLSSADPGSHEGHLGHAFLHTHARLASLAPRTGAVRLGQDRVDAGQFLRHELLYPPQSLLDGLQLPLHPQLQVVGSAFPLIRAVEELRRRSTRRRRQEQQPRQGVDHNQRQQRYSGDECDEPEDGSPFPEGSHGDPRLHHLEHHAGQEILHAVSLGRVLRAGAKDRLQLHRQLETSLVVEAQRAPHGEVVAVGDDGDEDVEHEHVHDEQIHHEHHNSHLSRQAVVRRREPAALEVAEQHAVAGQHRLAERGEGFLVLGVAKGTVVPRTYQHEQHVGKGQQDDEQHDHEAAQVARDL
eukprot:scaffold5517_cov239-Pinguiococcus_pyrenoidosus.AAC.3